MNALLALAIISSGMNHQPADSIRVVPGYGTVYHMPREETERQLYHLSTNFTIEDDWLASDSMVVDVGFNEQHSSVEELNDYVDSIATTFPKGSTIFSYHVHPNDDMMNPPSTMDIATHISQKESFRDEGMKMVSKVFDASGCWEYNAAPGLEKRLMHGFKKYMASTILEKYNALDEEWGSIQQYIIEMRKIGIILRYTFMNEPEDEVPYPFEKTMLDVK